MPVQCSVCAKELKRITPTHLRLHGISSEEYKIKFPEAILVDPEIVSRIAGSNKGKKHTEEFKAMMSLLKKESYENDPELRKRVSEGTKNGMHAPESWEKFTSYISQRDTSGNKNNFFGKHHAEETKRNISENKERSSKISVKKTEWWANGRTGKKVEELFGEEIGKQIREKKSENMLKAISSGNNVSGRKIGRYKGKLFRSVYEYFYYKHLENEGIDLSDVDYEPFCIRYEKDNHIRRYYPDFLVKPSKLLVEVKSSFTYKSCFDSEIVLVKKKAAEEFCKKMDLTYKILTEDDFKIGKYSDAYKDPDIEWIRR